MKIYNIGPPSCRPTIQEMEQNLSKVTHIGWSGSKLNPTHCVLWPMMFMLNMTIRSKVLSTTEESDHEM